MPIYFHIPDFTRHFNLNFMLLMLMKKFPDCFRDGVQIASMYGEFPSSQWNGGRCMGGIFEKKQIKQIIQMLNQEGISLRYTFTNPLIEEQHLDDPHCNDCLKMAETPDKRNGVILTSPVLEAYIRSHYPGFQITSSTCKQITDYDKLVEELDKDYDYVVLDYNFNNQWETLEQLPHKEKVELLVNAVCPPACPRRHEHYQYLARTQLRYSEHLKTKGPQAAFHNPERFTCPHSERLLYDTTGFSTHITPDDIYEKYVPMGFRNFKIEGRSGLSFNVMETYIYYLVKPEYRDKIRLMYLLSLQNSEVISFNG